ncbi:MAG TPA: S-methyl-5'-thioinosine phosphorylase [Clostridiales bacterium UBA8960]|jgi:5'-methylthioadenosine phosphorylase|nr:S-methyl-5'-thioinosine phosphorylase [Clostridiales bacterium UBA8960]
MRKAIIGGTGIYDAFDQAEAKTILTAFGEVSYDLVNVEGTEIVFLARHGKSHNVPPHKINYRANMMALKMLDVDEVYATCAVGSMNASFTPGDVVLINDFIDFTKHRIQTFFEGDLDKVAHVEMTDPYCAVLRKRFVEAVMSTSVDYKGEAVYVCTEGPRFETAAEIRMFKHIGGDVVGMTNCPESVLAKELGLCYSAVGIITNWCTGIQGDHIEGHQINESVLKNKLMLTNIFVSILKTQSKEKTCKCDHSLIVV